MASVWREGRKGILDQDVNESKSTKARMGKGFMSLEAGGTGELKHHDAREQRVLEKWPKLCVPSWAREGGMDT